MREIIFKEYKRKYKAAEQSLSQSEYKIPSESKTCRSLDNEQMYGRKYEYLHFCLEGWRSVGMAIAKGAKVVTLQIFADEVNTGETVTIETEELSDCDFDQNGRYSIPTEDILAE